MEDNPISIIAVEPDHIDSLLDNRVSIWVMRSPTKVGFLDANEA